MSKLKKILASLLAVAMLASMGTVVMASDVVMPRGWAACPSCKQGVFSVSTGSPYNVYTKDVACRGGSPSCRDVLYTGKWNVTYRCNACGWIGTESPNITQVVCASGYGYNWR